MMDDIDRECCGQFENMILDNIPEGWKCIHKEFLDPHIVLTFDHPDSGFVGNPTVKIHIRYGK